MTRSPFRGLRIAALIGAATLTAVTLSACSDQDDSGSDPKKITVLSQWEKGNDTGEEFARQVKQFTKETGIKVEVKEVNYADLVKSYETSRLAGKEADVIINNLTPDDSDWLPDGDIVDVKKYMDDWGITEKVQPAAVEYWTQGEDGTAGFPILSFNWPIWYNMDLMNKAGVTEVPKTTDELITVAKKLRKAGIQPFVVGGGDWPVGNFTTWMAQQYLSPDEAGKIFKNGGYCDSPGAMKGLELFAKLRNEGVFIDNVQGFNADQMVSQYYNGKAAMMPSGSWAYNTTKPDMAKSTELAGFPLPPGAHYQKPTAYNGYNVGIMISPKGEKNLGAIEKLVKFMYAKKNLVSWVENGSQILAAKPEALGDGVKAKNEMVLKGNKVTPDVVDFMLLPDNYIPAGFDYTPAATKFIGSKSEKATDFCKALDKLYVDKE